MTITAQLPGGSGVTRKAAGLILVFFTAIVWVFASFISESLVSSTSSSGPKVPPFLLTWLATTLFTLYLPVVHIQQCINDFLGAHKQSSSDNSDRKPGTGGSHGTQYDSTDAADGSSERLLATEGSGKEQKQLDEATTESQAWSAALWATPIWFFAQYTFNLSLAMTTVTSNTILSSTSSLFTFLLSVALLGEKFSFKKLLCILACMAGTALVTVSDVESEEATNSHPNSPPGRLLLHASNVYATATRTHGTIGSSWLSHVTLHTAALPRQLLASDHTMFSDISSPYMNTANGLVADPPANAPTKAPFLGDMLVLVSGAFYAGYTVVMRMKMPGEEAGQQVAHFFGYVGLLTTICLGPLVIILMSTGSINLAAIPRDAYLIILLEGLLDYVLSDYLWARAVMLIGPTVATLSLSVQIPLAAAVDLLSSTPPTWTRHGGTIALTLLGTALIIAGFVGINLSESGEDTGDAAKHESNRKPVAQFLQSAKDVVQGSPRQKASIDSLEGQSADTSQYSSTTVRRARGSPGPEAGLGYHRLPVSELEHHQSPLMRQS